jgi:SAM-dependent methyltransferase
MGPATQARTSDHGKAITRSILQQLSRQLTKLISRAAGTSDWSTYQHTPSSYSEDESATKLRAVASVIDTLQPTQVLDLGTNLGHHAFLAAERGARVVAVDSDAASIEQLYRRAKDLRADILPLVLDLGRPTPSMGWNLSEERSWQSRAEGKFDLVMMLALIHHMLVIERIPLAEILRLASRLTRKHLLIEWVDPRDDHFQRIAGPNLPLYRDLDAARFEAAATEHFDIISRVPLKGGLRCLYGMTLRHPS